MSTVGSTVRQGRAASHAKAPLRLRLFNPRDQIRRSSAFFFVAAAVVIAAAGTTTVCAHNDAPSRVLIADRALHNRSPSHGDRTRVAAKPASETFVPADLNPPWAECMVLPDTVSSRSATRFEPPPVPARRRETSCFMQAKDAIARASSGQLLIVDVRSNEAFSQYRIAGALNIGLGFVKSKDFLKAKPLVLVNEGGYSTPLEAACAQLKTVGFTQLRVLRGGLHAWKRAGGRLEGDLFAQQRTNKISAAEFAEERAYADWLVVDVSRRSRSEVQSYFPGAVSLPSSSDSHLQPLFKSIVEKRAGKRKELNVLVVAADGGYERLEASLAGSVPQPLFFLDGGWTAYTKFWNEQHAIWTAASRAPRSAKCGA